MLHVKKADIVIIGGGAAGTLAAIHARRVNPAAKVVVLDKSRIETSGGAGRGMDAINTIPLPPYSDPGDFVEMQTKITHTSGPALDKPVDIVGILSNLAAGEVLFIDEIHRLSTTIEEYLY